MKIERPSKQQDYDELLVVWEAAVRSSHDFLTEEDIRYYRPLVRKVYLLQVDLYMIRGVDGAIAAFMGLSEEGIEMLFVRPDEQGHGYGRCLLRFAVRERCLFRVDVNEQNEKALAFYRHLGFRAVGRDELDGQGRPFPILHLELSSIDRII